MKTSTKFLTLVAVSLMAMGTVAEARMSSHAENRCAAGNKAPVGANCTP